MHRHEGPEAEPVAGKQTLTEDMILQARAGGGSSLDGELRAELEHALGTSLDDVRLHANADAAARAVDADAFAYGQDVFFAGTPDASTPQGRSLIAHEVAHTVQQRGARTSSLPEVSSPGDAHEIEAEQFASAFVVGSTTPITPVRAGSVSRRAIARQAAGTQPPPPAPRRDEPPEAFTIQPASNVATVGPAVYRIPGAEQPSPGGRYLCTWTIELDPRAPGIRERRHVTRPT